MTQPTVTMSKAVQGTNSMLEQAGLSWNEPSAAAQYCKAIDDYIANRIDEREMWSRIATSKYHPEWN